MCDNPDTRATEGCWDRPKSTIRCYSNGPIPTYRGRGSGIRPLYPLLAGEVRKLQVSFVDMGRLHGWMCYTVSDCDYHVFECLAEAAIVGEVVSVTISNMHCNSKGNKKSIAM